MYSMFYSALAFDQPLDSWNMSKVKTTERMFSGAESFNQPIDSWDMSKNEDMHRMFSLSPKRTTSKTPEGRRATEGPMENTPGGTRTRDLPGNCVTEA